MDPLFTKIRSYAGKFSNSFHFVLAFSSLVIFISIITFGFVPVTKQIERSGYSTTDLQGANSRAEVDTILTAFQSVMEYIVLLSVLDYIFIISGFLLFVSIHSITINLLDSFEHHPRLDYIPMIGVVLTFVSRSLDALENLWTIIIYTNSDDYHSIFIFLMGNTSFLKWIFVVFEYSFLLISIGISIFVWFKSLSTDEIR